ncbi:four helix bundle protein [Leeuwenhoekiella sp. NPDC079379]|uniref:four helix bundle protein n=1 Tax=unclassified Leeuwenhoekiella TaxID=2615029 RepID=UPI0037C73888
MGTIKRFEDLEIWQLARLICIDIEQLFLNTDLGKNYSLRNQMERSSGSIMDNIAEGFDRDGNREFIVFLSYSKGSAGELKSQLYRSFDKALISKNQFDECSSKCQELQNKIGGFMNYLKNSEFKGSKFKR